MSVEKDGVISFWVRFFEKHCSMEKINSKLRENSSLKYGFQGQKDTLYDFNGLKDVLQGESYVYGQKIGLFVLNENTKKREEFNFQMPIPQGVIYGDQVVEEPREVDITRIIDIISE